MLLLGEQSGHTLCDRGDTKQPCSPTGVRARELPDVRGCVASQRTFDALYGSPTHVFCLSRGHAAQVTLQRQTPASSPPHPAGPRTARMLPGVSGHSAPNSSAARGRGGRPRAESDLGDLALQKCPPALCGRNFVPDPCNQIVKIEHPAVPQSAGPAGPVRPSHAVVPLARRSAGELQGNGLGSGARGRCRPGSARRAHQRYFETSHGVPRVRAALRRPPYTPAPPAPAPIGARF
jgi:hypothetical protein